MNRRGFLQRVGAAVAGYALAGHLAGIVPKPLAFEAPTGQSIHRIDVMYGWSTLRPEWVVRVVQDAESAPFWRRVLRLA